MAIPYKQTEPLDLLGVALARPMPKVRAVGAKLVKSQFEYIHFPLEEFNCDAQLVAIRSVLYRQERADEELSDSIKEADGVARQTRGRANDYAVDVHGELAEMACYQAAAHSMAAVGMLAPLIESVFQAAFRFIGKELRQGCLVKNIVKRVEEVGMREYMPADLEPILSALFKSRNKMFHGGFKWSKDELKKFESLLKEGRWPRYWFSKATLGDEPWMFYMTSAFVGRCLKMAEEVIRGIEQFGLEGPDSTLGPASMPATR